MKIKHQISCLITAIFLIGATSSVNAETNELKLDPFAKLMLKGLDDSLKWPIHVAPDGCTFEWEGTNNYRETARSHGPDTFPALKFWRKDKPSTIKIFAPFCGGDCFHPKLRPTLHKLFPLEAGKVVEANFDNPLGKGTLKFTVVGTEKMPRLDNMEAFRVKTEREIFSKKRNEVVLQTSQESWWAPEIGWLVKFKKKGFEKSVYEFSCPATSQSTD